MIKASFKIVMSKRSKSIADFHTISLNCLSKEGLDKLKISHKVQYIQPCNKEETSVNLLKLLPKFNSFLLKKSILTADADTRFDITFSQKFFGAILPAASIQDLRDLRAILATARYRSLFELDEAILDKLVLRCIALGDVIEGLQWMMLAEDMHKLLLSPSSYDAVLQAAIFSNTWDVLHYLLQDMQQRSHALAPHMLELIVKESCKQPFMRWRLVQKLLLNSAATVDQGVMALALQTLTSAHQHKAACFLYRTHARSLDRINNSIYDADFLYRTTQMAMQSQDFQLMQEVLLNCCSVNCDSISRGVSEQDDWLVRYVDHLLSSSPDAPLSSGPAMGCVVGWLLAYGKTDSAVAVWNAHMASIKHYTTESLEDEDQRVHNTLGTVITQIARLGSTHLCGQTQLIATAKFLRTVLMGTSESGSNIPALVEVHLSNGLITESLVSLFTQVQDVDAVSIILTKSLAQGFLMPEVLMNDALQLFQKHEDHELVLELFEMYLGINDPRRAAQPRTAKTKNASRPRRIGLQRDVVSSTNHSSLGSFFASELFTVAMHSFAARNDFASMISILTDVIPSRGFIPKVSAYAMAMHTLSKHDMNLEVNSLYVQSQELYSSILQAKKLGERTVPLGYGVGCIVLADIALRSCAKGGRLGVAALEIFQGIDTAHRRGITILKPSDAGMFAELVILALSTPDYVVIIPQFLDSMRGIEASIVVPDRVLVTALAAAVAVRNDHVAAEVARLIEKTHKKSLASIVSLSDLLRVLDNSFGVKDSDAVISFVQSCEALCTLKLS